MRPAYAMKLGVTIKKAEVRAQKINESHSEYATLL